MAYLSFDKPLWNELSEEERLEWTEWAASCGADEEMQLVDRNPYYPDMVLMPTVSSDTPDEDLLGWLESGLD